MELLCKLFGHKTGYNGQYVTERDKPKGECPDKRPEFNPPTIQKPEQMDCITWYNAITKKPYMVQDVNTYNRLQKLNDMLDGVLK